MNSGPKVLLSAYACEPGKGSEPGVGWRWANGLASRVNLHVLTREDNRIAIEKAVAASDERDPIRRARFIYFDLGSTALALKRKGWLPTAAYYVMWQLGVRRKFADLADSMDVVHHLTFCNLLCPGFWKLRKSAFVIGPVGAPLVPASYLSLFGGGRFIQRIRGMILRNFHRLPWLNRLLRSAAAIVPANSDAKVLLESRGFACESPMLDTGAPEIRPRAKRDASATLRFVSAGRLERRKGLELALKAFAQASIEWTEWRFTIIGGGPDAPRLKSMVLELGIGDRVEFTGQVPLERTHELLSQSDVFVFTSIRDTSGSVNLEAMANGLPIVCISHQGVGDITDPSCALRVPPGGIEETIRNLASSILRFRDEPQLIESLGTNAALRAQSVFSWETKFDHMVPIYLKAMGAASR